MSLFLSVFTVVLAAVGAAVCAGTFVSFSVVVMPAIRQLKPGHAVVAMRSVARSAVRWPALLVLGVSGLAVILAPVLAFTSDAGGPNPWWTLAGTLLALAGFVVTGVGTRPLAVRLGSMGPADAVVFWPQFAERWTAWNDVRAAATGAGSVLLVVSLVA